MTAEAKAIINAELARTSARVEALARDLEDLIGSAEGSPPDDEHDPDGATSGFERAQLSALLEQARAELAELRAALARLDDGRYGVCERCGRPIGAARLEARPAVRTCVACAGVAR